jgi:hypothetical protein
MEIHRRVIEQELEDIESGSLTKEEEWAARVRLESSQKMLKQLEARNHERHERN